MNMEQNKSLDFTSSANFENNPEKIIVPGVGTMTIDEAKSLVSPGKIPGSNIEFTPDYIFGKIKSIKRCNGRT